MALISSLLHSWRVGQFAVNRVTPDRAARDVETAMTNGMSFKDAMAHHGSPELAQYLGGEMRDDTRGQEESSVPPNHPRDAQERNRRGSTALQ